MLHLRRRRGRRPAVAGRQDRREDAVGQRLQRGRRQQSGDGRLTQQINGGQFASPAQSH